MPLGVFLILHLWSYSSALNGRHAFEERFAESTSSPYHWVLEALLVWLPLAFHAGYGLVISFEARPNVRRYPYGRNWSYLLQRLSAIVVLLFIGHHAYHVPIQVALGNLEPHGIFPELCASLSATMAGGIPVMAVGYLIGIAATCYHFANGLTNFCFSWGITTSRAANRRAAGIAGLIAIALFALGASSVIYFATGSRLVLNWSSGASSPPAIGCGDLEPGKAIGTSTPLLPTRLASWQPIDSRENEAQ